MNVLGLLEAFDTHGALLVRTPVTHWPVVVGRALACDMVLDDPHIAAAHLRIDRPQGAAGGMTVEVLNTTNGVGLNGKNFAQGSQLDWPDATLLDLGRVRLALRLADENIAPEQLLPHFPWRTVGWTVAALIGALACSLVLAWLQTADPAKFLQTVPMLLVFLLLSLGIWAGLWAVANKLFAGQLQFWRHVRIACATYLAVEVANGLANVGAFAFSWESLARFDHLLTAVMVTAGIYAHLAALLPRRRVWLATALLALLAAGIPLWLGSQWLDKKRLSNELYLSSLFPPSLRLAATVPVPQFLQESQILQQRLAKRLADGEQDNAGEEDDGE